MSPGAKPKSKKEKASAKGGKGQQKTPTKASGSSNTVSGNGNPASAYNPISGTFHTLEIPSAASYDNGHFKNTDDTDEHSSSPHGTVSEYDSVSNNGSCSGESEDPKDKTTNLNRQETVPGLDNDKREKIRLKNEKKHQRQRERRAQELHERCIGYLMSRKLEALTQQLVAMGFSHERATLALVLNEGRLEASVNWLFEGNEEEARNKETRLGSADNLKIDISEELAQISPMELRYKCSRQEVERAIVACEGDLIKAEEMLEAHKRESPATPPTPEESTDANHMKRMQEKSMLISPISIQQKRNEQDLNFAKPAFSPPTYSEPGIRNFQAPNQTKTLADRRWPAPGSSPTFSTPMQVTPTLAKSEVRLGVSGNEGKNHQQLLREPVVVMQRPQSMNAKQNQVPSMGALPSVTSGWYSSNVPGAENILSNGNLFHNQSAMNVGLVNQRTEQFYQPASYKESSFSSNASVDPSYGGFGASWSTMSKSPSLAIPYESYGPTNAASSPSLAAPSSLGLFTGWGSSPHVDWSTGGSMPEFDYTSIDWTLDFNPLNSKPPSGLWMGLSSLLNNSSGSGMNGMASPYVSGFRDGGAVKEATSASGVHEWTSPFAGKDMFSLPRQFVTSPSP
ncbi:Ubiquitin-associated/translation elongation factor EF1B protein [Euphorbia peplus]|nr:Ubiquitin-associated/translation elongation factor EF1B protein [Euphorbia peplus]